MRASARVVAVLGPTNTGKTHYAIERMLAHRTGVIGLPLRLLARDSGDVALLPAVVVQDELQAGVLQLYAQIPEITEQFFAVTQQRHFNLGILDELLSAH